jgi:hypothetical protein
MAEKFTVYSFQLRPDDFTRFTGGVESDSESYSEDEYSNIFGGIEKQDITNMAADISEEPIFVIDPDEEVDIFNLETEL